MLRRRSTFVLLVSMAAAAVVLLASRVAAQDDMPVPSPSPPSAPPYPFPGIPDDPDQADRNCRLLGPFALFVQAVMGVVVVGSLVLKRQREKPKRPWKIWTLDISKQMLGQLFVHTLNVVLSSLGSIASEGENNPCSLYFLNIAVDTTVGVLFIYYSMRYLTHYFTDVLGWPGFVSGQYFSTPPVLGRRRRAGPRRMSTSSVPDSPHAAGPSMERQQSSRSVESTMRRSNKPRLSFFFRQLALYLLSLLLMKVMVVLLFALFPFLFAIGRWVLDLFGEHKKGQIFFVMALFPLAMNTLQFWLIDSVLRHDPNTSKYRLEEDLPNGHANDDLGISTAGHDGDLERGPVDGEEHARGPWTASWWVDAFRGRASSDRQRGRYQELGRHSIGEANTEDEEEDEHTYPPNSQSSSVAQLDVDAGQGANGTSHRKSDIAYGATQRSPSLDAQSKAANGRQHEVDQQSTSEAAERGGDDDMQEAWDAWSDEEQKGQTGKESEPSAYTEHNKKLHPIIGCLPTT